MVNGAAPICEIDCPTCGYHYSLTTKLCPQCKSCSRCKRIGKRFYQFESDAPGLRISDEIASPPSNVTD
jgi:hypothetical protein